MQFCNSALRWITFGTITKHKLKKNKNYQKKTEKHYVLLIKTKTTKIGTVHFIDKTLGLIIQENYNLT